MLAMLCPSPLRSWLTLGCDIDAEELVYYPEPPFAKDLP
jgi:hypothetical protein